MNHNKRTLWNHEEDKFTRQSIIQAFDSSIVRWYCTIRFLIINLRMLTEIEQYIPERAKVLDVGCGFGLFSLYFAARSTERVVTGFDLNPRRIDLATRTANKLGLSDVVSFMPENVVNFASRHQDNVDEGAGYDAIITLDLIHHVPPAAAPAIIQAAYNLLAPGGVLIVKDIDSSPWPKVVFTWLLDKMMDWKTPVCYRSRQEMTALLSSAGFEVRSHEMRDILPYPHVLYICRKSSADSRG